MTGIGPGSKFGGFSTVSERPWETIKMVPTSTVNGHVVFSGNVAPGKAGHVIYLEKLGKDNPDVGVAFLNLGDVYRNMGQYDKAESHFLRSLEIVIGKSRIPGFKCRIGLLRLLNGDLA